METLSLPVRRHVLPLLWWVISLSVVGLATNAQAQAWQPAGPNDFASTWASLESVGNVHLAVSPNGTPYAAYRDYLGFATVVKYDGSNWVPVGNPGFSAGKVSAPKIAIDAMGTPYVAYEDIANNYKATVMKFDGSSWVAVGDPGPSKVSAVSLFLDAAGTPYISFKDIYYGSGVSVQKFDGSNWNFVGERSISGIHLNAESPLAFDAAGTPYIAYSDGFYEYKVTVRKFNGSSWEKVGTSGFSPSSTSSISIAFNAAGILYVAYQCYIDPFNGVKVKVVKYTGNSWVPLTQTDISPYMEADPQIAFDSKGDLYVAYQGGLSGIALKLAKHTGSSWTSIGSINTVTKTSYLSFAIDANDIMYVAYRDGNNLSKATVMKYDGSNWMEMGRAGITTHKIAYSALATDVSGTPYIAYQDVSVNDKITVKRYTGNSWQTVGNAGFSAGGVTAVAIALDNGGTPYVAYVDATNSSKTTVMKYTGSSWVLVGNAGFSAGSVAYLSLAIDGNGAPHVAYRDAINSLTATVMAYLNGAWVTLGSPGFSTGQANFLSLAITSNGKPCVAYQDVANGQKVTVMRYNGTGWNTVGTAGFSAHPADLITLAFDGNDNYYVVYREAANGYKTTAMKYDGTNWVSVGNPGISAGATSAPTLALDAAGVPYVAYQDSANGNRITAMRYNGAGWESVGDPGFGAPGAGSPLLKVTGANIFATYVSHGWLFARFYAPCSVQTVTAHPLSVTACTGYPSGFSASFAIANPSYQWQAKAPNGIFSNIIAGGQYSGDTTAALTINNATGLGGHQFRCIAMGPTCSITTLPATLSLDTVPANVLAAPGIVRTADAECTDGAGWTHYYNTSANEIVLSVKKNGNNIGVIGSGLVVSAFSNNNWSDSTAAHILPNNNYVVNTSWRVMNRWWDVTPVNQPISDVQVRSYYTQDDLEGVRISTGDSTLLHTQLRMYKINDALSGSPYVVDPGSGHVGIPAATAYDQPGYWEYAHGNAGTTTTWAWDSLSGGFSAEYTIAHFSGGGGGGAPGGSSVFWVVGVDKPVSPVSVWPNPTHAELHLAATTGAVWSLCDLAGRTLLHGTLTADHEHLNTGSLPPGIYLLHVDTISMRIVIE